MPNHVTQILRAEGPDAFERMNHYFTDFDEVGEFNGKREQWRGFDFNKLIPMPEILRGAIEAGYERYLPILLMTDGCAQAWEALRSFDREGILGPWPGLVGLRSGDIERKLEALHPGCVEQARLVALRYGTTGYKGWYDWAIAHWDTKWNAYSCGDLEGVGSMASIKFDTAWACPLPILRKLTENEPTLHFDYVAFCEHTEFYARGHGYAGEFTLEIERYPIARTEQMLADYLRVYGEPLTEDEEGAPPSP